MSHHAHDFGSDTRIADELPKRRAPVNPAPVLPPTVWPWPHAETPVRRARVVQVLHPTRSSVPLYVTEKQSDDGARVPAMRAEEV